MNDNKNVLSVDSKVLVRVFVEFLMREGHINNATYLNALDELKKEEKKYVIKK